MNPIAPNEEQLDSILTSLKPRMNAARQRRMRMAAAAWLFKRQDL